MAHSYKETHHKSQEFGITASITQTQGNGTLTANLNEISIVANVNDTVTLPISVEGFEILIINNGENTLQLFPPVGDDLGNGSNVSTSLETNEEIKLMKLEGTFWHIENTTEIFHSGIGFEDNTTEFTISKVNELHCYHNSTIAVEDVLDWVYEAGGTAVIDEILDEGGGDIRVRTTTVHNLTAGDIISQNNMTDSAYAKVFVVKSIVDTTHYIVTAVFTAGGTGTMNKAATLTCNSIAAGAYTLTYDFSAIAATSNDKFKFFVYKNATKIPKSKKKRKFNVAGDEYDVGRTVLFSVDGGDKISFVLQNIVSAGNITPDDYDLILTKL